VRKGLSGNQSKREKIFAFLNKLHPLHNTNYQILTGKNLYFTGKLWYRVFLIDDCRAPAI